ncbi:MAG: molybdenum cofactor synthesis protein [Bacteriovoracaceae bacterium]|nr:molybdenum cofactor synthesis protein [Bacteriovoracaceae bacterium]
MKAVSVNISKQKGTSKEPVQTIKLNNAGIIGDAHAGNGHRLVSLLSLEDIANFSKKENREFRAGEFAENITTQGIDMSQVSVFDRFIFGDVEIEVTQIGKKCHGTGCAIFSEVGKCVMPKEGIFCRVISGGEIATGDTFTHKPRQFNFKIITLSDRAYNNEYDDRSGPQVEKLLIKHFENTRYRINIKKELIADNEEMLRSLLNKFVLEKDDLVITTGGTGIGLSDITPEVVENFCQKLIPGIMENIRLKYGQDKPNALLSRSVAGVCDQTLIYTLPGSVNAVREYMDEILKTMEHLFLMLHGIGH